MRRTFSRALLALLPLLLLVVVLAPRLDAGTPATALMFSNGALGLGAKPTGTQVLGLSGGVVRGVDAVTDPGSATNGDVLAYYTGAPTWMAPVADLGLLTSATAASTYQPLDADLTSWAAAGPSAWTGSTSITTLGTIATGTWSGTTIALNKGGTGATTAAAARDNILWSGAGLISCASPCTPGVGVVNVTVSGTVTINLPTLSTFVDGQRQNYICDSGPCTITLDPSDSGTCNGGAAGAACAAIDVPAGGLVGVVRTSPSSWRSVQSGLTANAAFVEVTGGQIVARGGIVLPSGGFRPTSQAVVMTAEDDTYGEVISGDTVTIAGAGLVTGDFGGLSANSRRYVTTLAALGITFADTSPRQVAIKLLCDDLTDNGEARVSNIALYTWLAAGSSTAALDGIGIRRASTGSDTWEPIWFRGTSSSTTSGTASNLNFGAFAIHEFPTSDNGLLWGGVDSVGGTRAVTASASGAIPGSLPDYLVWAWRASAGASGAVYQDCRALYVFTGNIEDL